MMRLLRTDRGAGLKLIEKWGSDVPKYAILSHTWSREPKDEVVFQDVQHGTFAEKPAFQKVKSALKLAEQDSFDYLWVDTCCIDKTSASECNEAINSMFQYYQNAEVCYVYLADVQGMHDLPRSRWWQLGFTLQELMAPKIVEFYSSDWTLLGDRASLSSPICLITGIAERYLLNEELTRSASIAQRMSWAARRQTTREEDTAYCLRGIFDVNMPAMYGEGEEKAFIRLQQQIMQSSEDQSIFAWTDAAKSLEKGCGMLAHSPRSFLRSGNIDSCGEILQGSLPVLTANGLRITLPLGFNGNGITVALLNCRAEGCENNDRVAICLRRITQIGAISQYERIYADTFMPHASEFQLEEIYVRQFGGPQRSKARSCM
jgi:hypothetical protein